MLKYINKRINININNINNNYDYINNNRIISCCYYSIDQRGSNEKGVKIRFYRKPKYFQRSKSIHGRYISPWKSNKKNIQDAIYLLFSNTKNFFKQKKILNAPEIPYYKVNQQIIKSTDKTHLTWLGHATCYVQFEGKYFLTDPIWSERASPFKNFGPMRCVPPPISLDDLHIDYVLLSHTHYDHYDIDTAKKIGNRAIWIVPKGVQSILKSIGITNSIELDWWQTHLININNNDSDNNSDNNNSNSKSIEIVFTPTQHWSSRSLFDRGSSLWGSYALLSSKSRFFFTGDTAYCSVFKDIGETYGPFDLAAIPIGAYKPRQFMKDVHCDPKEAILIHQDLKAKQSVAIHWGTFELSEEEFIEPALELGRVRKVLGVNEKEIFTLGHGETFTIGSNPMNDISILHPHLLEEHSKSYETELEENCIASSSSLSPPPSPSSISSISLSSFKSLKSNISLSLSSLSTLLKTKASNSFKTTKFTTSLGIRENQKFIKASETLKKMSDPLKNARIIWGSSPRDSSH